MSNGRTLEATGYVQLRYDNFGSYSKEMRVAKITQAKPDAALPGAIVLKVKFRVPVEAFEPLEPTAVIEVPADLIQHEITAEATK